MVRAATVSYSFMRLSRNSFRCVSKTESIVWKFVSAQQLQDLAQVHSVEACRRYRQQFSKHWCLSANTAGICSDLAVIFKLDLEDETHGFRVDFQLHNYSYPSQLSTASACLYH